MRPLVAFSMETRNLDHWSPGGKGFHVELARDFRWDFRPRDFETMICKGLHPSVGIGVFAYNAIDEWCRNHSYRGAYITHAQFRWVCENVTDWFWDFKTEAAVKGSVITVVLIFTQEVDRLAYLLRFGQPELQPMDAYR